MLDFGNIPSYTPYDQQIFVGNVRNASASAMATWTKPRGVTFIHILCIGQGGDGTAGAVGATALGGVGGGSGGQSSLLINAALLPQILYVSAGAGGANQNSTTWVSVRPHGATAASIPVASDLVMLANGAQGTVVTGAPAAAASGCILSGLGVAAFLAGVNGGAAGAVTPTAGGSPAAVTTGLIVQGGGGGGGMSAAATAAGGAPVTSFPSWLLTTPAGAGGSSGVDGGKGGDGMAQFFNQAAPLCFNGGGGGGSGFPTATTSNGGNGGNGAYGCGGGGGGGAVTGKTAGTAGKGGPGIVIITCW